MSTPSPADFLEKFCETSTKVPKLFAAVAKSLKIDQYQGDKDTLEFQGVKEACNKELLEALSHDKPKASN